MNEIDRNIARWLFYDLKDFLSFSYSDLGLTDRLVRYVGEGKVKHSRKMQKAIERMLIEVSHHRSIVKDYAIYGKGYDDEGLEVGWNSAFRGFMRWNFEGAKYLYVSVGREKRTVKVSYAYTDKKVYVKLKYPFLYSLKNYTGVDWDNGVADNINECVKKYRVDDYVIVKSTKNMHGLFYAVDLFYNRHFALRECLNDDEKRVKLDMKRAMRRRVFNRLWKKKERLGFKKTRKVLAEVVDNAKGKCQDLVKALNDDGVIDFVGSFKVWHAFSKKFIWHVVGAKIIDGKYYLFFDFTAKQFKGLKSQMFLVDKETLTNETLNMPHGWRYKFEDRKTLSFYS